MLSKGKLLLYIQDDDSIYRLLLLGLAISSPALHYLCFGRVYDPLLLRGISSLICLVTVIFSFSPKQRKAYVGLRYLAMVLYLVVNNGLLLGANNFANVYLLSSVTVFIALTLFCRTARGFIRLSILNLLVITAAYLSDRDREIPLFALILLLLTFTLIAYVSFIVRVIFKYKLSRAVKNLTELNDTLLQNEEELKQNRNQLHWLINSINEILLEFNEDKVCIKAWFNENETRAVSPKLFENKRLDDVLGEEKARTLNDAIDYVVQTRQTQAIQFQSFFGTDRWFAAKASPVFDLDGVYTNRIVVAVSDITEQKRYETALKENERQLMEAQLIARIGDWWFDTSQKKLFWSTSLYTLLETDLAPSRRNNFSFYISLVHPEDRKKVLSSFSGIIHNNGTDIEHRLITPKGNLKHIRIRTGRPVTDQAGSIIRINGIIQDITESKVTEKIVKKSQADLMEAQSIAKIGNWKWNAVHTRFTWSEEICRIYELSPEKLNGAFSVKYLLQSAHPDDRALLLKLFKEAKQIDQTSYEYRIITPDKTTKYLSLIVGKVMRNADGSLKRLIGTIQDVTERKIAEINQQRTEDKYKLVLESINLAAVTLDAWGDIVFCNKYIADLLGYEQAELLGTSWFRFLDTDLQAEFSKWHLGNQIKTDFINPIICRNGEKRIVRWQNTVVYNVDGSIRETTSIGEDITEEQRDRQNLISAKELAEQSARYKSEFLSIMSHEIRTPMNAVIGITNLLFSEDPKPEQMQYLNALKFSGENLLAIINDILDYNRIEVGKMELSHTIFNIHDLARNIQQIFYPKAAEKRLEIITKVDPSISRALIGDQVRLGQILSNLLSNALKFTHKGTISIILNKINSENDSETIEFIVADTGIGIARKNLQKIFDPFTQETEATHSYYGGSGLGLAITKKLVELQQGHIEVESEFNRGTTFTFRISFKIAQATHTIEGSAGSNNPDSRTLQGMRVLIVDDNQMNLMVASRFLNKWNIESDTALNGKVAVEKVQQADFDLVIMDLQMPIMDGFEATRIIRLYDADIPVVALTADAMPETYQRALDAGMNDLLTKPFKPESLFEKLTKFYGNTTMRD
jgi:PAS domain S-box-containing protein